MIYVVLGFAAAFTISGVVLVLLARHFRRQYAAILGTETASVGKLKERRKTAADTLLLVLLVVLLRMG